MGHESLGQVEEVGPEVSELEYPGSPVRGAIEDPLVRRNLMGLAMGLTAVGVIYSPWGQQSGAHISAAVTLNFAGASVLGVGAVGMTVNDMDRSVKFHTVVLGFEKIAE